QFYLVPNLGQTEHFVTISFATGNTGSASMYLQGSLGGFPYPISDVWLGSDDTSIQGTASGSGYYPQLYAVVTCPAASTYTVQYSGASITPLNIAGQSLSNQVGKEIFTLQLAAHTVIAPFVQFVPPFGSSQGMLVFSLSGTGPAGQVIAVNCLSPQTNPALSFSFVPSTAVGVQVFQVPPSPCSLLNVSYNASGTTAHTISVDYLFNPPGFSLAATSAAWSKAPITSASTVSVKGTGGVLFNVVVNTTVAGTIKLYDIGVAGCTGTPGSGLFATITTLAA